MAALRMVLPLELRYRFFMPLLAQRLPLYLLPLHAIRGFAFSPFYAALVVPGVLCAARSSRCLILQHLPAAAPDYLWICVHAFA